MVEISLVFTISVFVAGLLMFLAPCTLPLVPAYLAFISGVRSDDLRDPSETICARRKIIQSGLAFVIGFSITFILFGTLAGFVGAQIAEYQTVITKVGGIFIIIFGLMMVGLIKIDYLAHEHRLKFPAFLHPGRPTSAFVIGMTFAVGWTPCVGPVLASVLLLATTQATALQGAFMLTVFSVGLAIPFILVALLYARATQAITHLTAVTKWISVIGGVFLIGIGLLLVTNNFGLTIEYGFRLFDFLNYDALLDYL